MARLGVDRALGSRDLLADAIRRAVRPAEGQPAAVLSVDAPDADVVPFSAVRGFVARDPAEPLRRARPIADLAPDAGATTPRGRMRRSPEAGSIATPPAKRRSTSAKSAASSARGARAMRAWRGRSSGDLCPTRAEAVVSAGVGPAPPPRSGGRRESDCG